jgi:cob(I)alamin adenosyltransferase
MLRALSRLQTISRECMLVRSEIEQELGVTLHSEEMRKAALMHLDVVRAAVRAAERELQSMSVQRATADSYHG